MNKIKYLFLLTLCFAIMACGSSKKASEGKENTEKIEENNKKQEKQKQQEGQQQGQKQQGQKQKPVAEMPSITVSRFVSQLKVNIELDGSKYSLDGKISMKRGEVMRINLSFMGFIEVGIIEFSPKDILIVNRMGKEYTRMPYDAFDAFTRNNITYANMEYLAWEKLYTENGEASNLDKAIENLINSNIRSGKPVKVSIKVGKPDTSRDFTTYTTVKSSYKEVVPELLMARLMTFMK